MTHSMVTTITTTASHEVPPVICLQEDARPSYDHSTVDTITTTASHEVPPVICLWEETRPASELDVNSGTKGTRLIRIEICKS